MKKTAFWFMLLLSLPFLFIGCVSGWFSSAFMSGFRQGAKDYKEIDLE